MNLKEGKNFRQEMIHPETTIDAMLGLTIEQKEKIIWPKKSKKNVWADSLMYMFSLSAGES